MKYFCILWFFISFCNLSAFSHDINEERLETSTHYQAAIRTISHTYKQQKANVSTDDIDQLKLLTYKKELAIEIARIAATHLSEINWQAQSSFAQEAHQAFLEGDAQKGLEILGKGELEAALQEAKKNDANQAHLLNLCLNNYILKAFLSIFTFKPEEAEQYYIKALYEDQNDFVKNYELSLLLIRQKRWEKAKALCGHMLKIANSDYERIIATNLMGILYYDQHLDEEALNRFSDAYSLWVQNQKPTSDDIYQSLLANSWYNMGLILQKQQTQEKTREVFQEVLNIQNKQMRSLPIAYYTDAISTLEHIRDLYLYQTNIEHEKGIQIQSKIDSIYQAYQTIDTLTFPLHAYTSASLNSGRIHRDLGYHRNALNVYQSLLRNTEQAKNDEMTALTLGEIAKIHQLLGNVTLANNYWERTKGMLDTLMTKETVKTPVNLLQITTYLADFYTTQKAYQNAAKIYDNWDLWSKKFISDQNSTTEALIAHNLEHKAALFFARENFIQAEKLLKEATPIRKNLYVQNPLRHKASLINNYNRLINIYLSNQNLREVQRLMDTVGSLQPSDTGVLSLHEGIATVEYKLNQGLMYTQLWKYTEAGQALETAEKLIESSKYDYIIYKVLANRVIAAKGAMASKRGNHEEAARLYEYAKTQVSRLLNQDTHTYIKDWIVIALARSKALIELGKSEEAHLQLLEVEEIIQSKNYAQQGFMMTEQVLFNMRLANIYREKYDIEKALVAYLKAIDLSRGLQEKHPQGYKILSGDLYMELARYYVQIDNYEQALSSYQTAIQIKEGYAENQGSANKGNLTTIYFEMAQLHQTFTHFEEAIQTYQKLIGILEILVQSDSSYKSRLADIYSFMAWCSVLIQEFSHADAYIQAALVWDEEAKWLKVKMPIVYLLNDDFGEAKKLYEKYVDSTLDGAPMRQIYLADLSIIEARQIKHTQIQEAKKILIAGLK